MDKPKREKQRVPENKRHGELPKKNKTPMKDPEKNKTTQHVAGIHRTPMQKFEQSIKTKEQEDHRKRVESSTPKIDAKTPTIRSYVELNMKKKEHEKQRALEIERHNEVLRQRINRIKNSHGEIYTRSDPEKKKTTQQVAGIHLTPMQKFDQGIKKKEQEDHRKRVESSTPKIDAKTPTIRSYVELNMKKKEHEKQRALEIERHNEVLRQRINRIKSSHGEIYTRSDPEKKKTTQQVAGIHLSPMQKFEQSIKKKEQEDHRKRVESSTPKVDAKTPTIRSYVELNMKKKEHEKQRALEIQRHDEVLRQRITRIKNSHGEIYTRSDPEKKKTTQQVAGIHLTPMQKFEQSIKKKEQEDHRKRVESANPKVDSKTPTSCPHVELKPKKKEHEKQHALEIQRHDEVLRQRITRIKNSHGEIDTRSDPEKKKTKQPVAGKKLTPMQNLEQELKKKQQQVHRKRVESAKPVVDSFAKSYPHVELNLKKKLAEEEKKKNLKRENKILKDRLLQIKKSKGTSNK